MTATAAKPRLASVRTAQRHGALLGAKQAQDVLDERGLAGAICANEAIDRAASENEAHRVKGRLAIVAARQVHHVDC
jgi:hypothetical protein